MNELGQKLKDMPRTSVIVVEVPFEENELRLIAEFLKFKEGHNVIYVSSNRPAADLLERLSNHNFDLKRAVQTGKVCMIDLVSRSAGAKQVDGVIYVPSPSELSATQMAIEKAIERINSKGENNSKNTWLLLDSVSTLLVYNDSGALLQFLHYLIARLRVLQFGSVIFTFEHSLQDQVRSTIRQFCDMIIKP